MPNSYLMFQRKGHLLAHQLNYWKIMVKPWDALVHVFYRGFLEDVLDDLGASTCT